jgi:hypothetical protein
MPYYGKQDFLSKVNGNLSSQKVCEGRYKLRMESGSSFYRITIQTGS